MSTITEYYRYLNLKNKTFFFCSLSKAYQVLNAAARFRQQRMKPPCINLDVKSYVFVMRNQTLTSLISAYFFHPPNQLPNYIAFTQKISPFLPLPSLQIFNTSYLRLLTLTTFSLSSFYPNSTTQYCHFHLLDPYQAILPNWSS